MRVKKFFAPDMRQAMKQVRDELGPDAAILARTQKDNGVEIVCALDFIEEEQKVNGAYQQSLGELTTQAQDPLLPSDLNEARNKVLGGADVSVSMGNRILEAKRNILKSTYSDAFEDELSRAKDNILNGALHKKSSNSAKSDTDQKGIALNLIENLSKNSGYGSQNNSSGESLALQAMQSEIQSLRDLLLESMRDQEDKINPTEALIRKRLEAFGFEGEQVRKLLLSVDIKEEDSLEENWKKILVKLKSDILVLDEDLLDQGGVIAFIGPTGAGKTSTIGKLASRYVLKYGADSLALITTDSYRIAAYEQLRTFGRILGVPVRVLDGKDSIDTILKSLRNKTVIFIDTAGFANSDKGVEEQLKLLDSTKTRIRKILVLSATSQLGVLRSTCDTYYNQDLSGVVISKVDEATRFGDSLSVALAYRLPIAYITTGQRIPDDLQLAKSRDLVNLLLNMNEKKIQFKL